MPLPRPEIGLIVHYGFVRSGPDRGPPPDAGKDRPCLIVDLLPEEILGRKTLRVTYLPISHAEPRKGESAILIKAKVANYLGLTAGPRNCARSGILLVSGDVATPTVQV